MSDKKDKKFRNFEIMQQVKYLPDQDIASIKDVLDNNAGVKKYAYILHDQDTNGDGSKKEPHYHVMVNLETPRSLSTIVKMFGDTIPAQYFGDIKGRWSDALAYLTHANAPTKHQYDTEAVVANFEWEKEAISGKDNKLADILDDIVNGKIRKYNYTKHIPATMYIKHRRDIDTAFQYRADSIREANRNMRCIYISGGSGTGKTTYAKELAVKQGYSLFISSGSNDPLDGYEGQDCIILDDLRPSCMGLSDLLKMLDNNTASTVKSRYKNKVLECKLIIITTTLDIESFFKNVFSEEPETSVQLKRRCELMVRFPKNVSDGKLEVYQYDLAANKYELVGYQDNPLPHIITEDTTRKAEAVKTISSLGAITPPAPPAPPAVPAPKPKPKHFDPLAEPEPKKGKSKAKADEPLPF